MISDKSTLWQRARWAAPGLCCLIGCAAPRAQINAPLINVPGYSNLPRSSTTQASRPARRPVAAIPASRADSAGVPGYDLGRRAPSDVERGVARFTAEPNRLFHPSTATRPWQFIVLHHSAEPNGGYASIDRFHREVRGWDECGYHFVIGNGTESGDGEIEVGSRWTKQKHGAHTKPPGHDEYNELGIGICLIGNCNSSPPTAKQVEAARRLVAFLQGRFGVPASGIITHGDVEDAHTDCPGRYFPLDRIISNSGFAAR